MSPWQAALGDHFGELHPRLTAYFSLLPPGSIGFGEGVFDTVGTPRRWVRAMIRLFVDADVLFPVWVRNVPFTVTNSAVAETGYSAVGAVRVFRFPWGESPMQDLIMATPHGLVDVLGARQRFSALFTPEVLNGELHLASTRVTLRIGSHDVPLPRCISPRISLTERYSDADDRQYVALTMRVPFIGKVYEYAGSFRYTITVGAS